MILKKNPLLLVILLSHLIASAQTDSFHIENNAISRKFYFRTDSVGFITKELVNKASKENYVNPGTEEFSVLVNDKHITGLNTRVLSHAINKNGDTTRLTVKLQTPIENIFIELVYAMYAQLPVVRKHLRVINNSSSEVTVSNLDVEMLRLQVVHKYSNEVYANYGTHLTRIPYKGDYNDAVVMLYNASANQGAIFGNEAPGVLKNTEIYTEVHGRIQIGMRHINENFPFKKFLLPGDGFDSPGTFIYVFSSPNWTYGFEGDYKTFVRKYLGLRIQHTSKKPLSYYCTWLPYLDKINEKIVKHSADYLAKTGTDVFIIDAGWYLYSGDFLEDSIAFPGGLKNTCDYIRSKGMDVGLWFTLAAVNGNSKVAMANPGWLVKGKDGKPINLHSMDKYTEGTSWNSALRTMSLASPYYHYLRDIIKSYIQRLSIRYLKLDISAIASAYVHEPARSGDYEANSMKEYKDRAASYWLTYQRMMQLMDELHEAFPHLLIDCTFEAWGRYNVVDFALFQHADYEWLANVELDSLRGPISVRQMNYDRGRAIPNTGFLIGNLYMNSGNYQYGYYSLASANVVHVGEPVKLTGAQQAFYEKWNKYLEEIEAKYQYTQFFQLYDVFERPSISNWDGCFRFNTEKQGGLLFFYRNNSPDNQRTFRIPCVNENNRYKIYSHETGKVIGRYSGKTLIENGIRIVLGSPYSGTILTIEKE
jgi:alpha-galactosidase